VKAIEEAADPGAAFCRGGQAGGEGEGEKSGERRSAHGGKVAEAAGQRVVADGFGRMEVEEEVADFEGKVGGDEDVGVLWRAEDGAVIADAELEGMAAQMAGVRAEADAFDQREFGECSDGRRLFHGRLSSEGISEDMDLETSINGDGE